MAEWVFATVAARGACGVLVRCSQHDEHPTAICSCKCRHSRKSLGVPLQISLAPACPQVVLMQRWLQRVAQLLDSCFVGRPTAELFTVMICCPLLMNMVQVRVANCRVMPESVPALP